MGIRRELQDLGEFASPSLQLLHSGQAALVSIEASDFSPSVGE